MLLYERCFVPPVILIILRLQRLSHICRQSSWGRSFVWNPDDKGTEIRKKYQFLISICLHTIFEHQVLHSCFSSKFCFKILPSMAYILNCFLHAFAPNQYRKRKVCMFASCFSNYAAGKYPGTREYKCPQGYMNTYSAAILKDVLYDRPIRQV